MKEEGNGGGSELGSDLDLDPDTWKILWIRIWQSYADHLDPDPQHWSKGEGAAKQCKVKIQTR